MVCLNKLLENSPELKIASKGIQNEEDFFWACQLCEGNNLRCAEYVEDSSWKSQIVSNNKSYSIYL